MHFPISGVEVSPVVPVVVGFLIATCTTPAGVSGAFLLLPFQFSVLGFTTPGVTPTNLLYNVISTPGGIVSYRRSGIVDPALIRAIVGGAVPGVIAGAVLRVSILEEPDSFKVFAGCVLVLLGLNLIAQGAGRHVTDPAKEFSRAGVTALAAGAGVIGGIYGISGGSIIAPVLAARFRLPLERVAPAALTATLITSLVGVATFAAISVGGPDVRAARPDWALALLFGIGGAAGGYVGAKLNRRASEVLLRILLGVLALALGASYIWPR